MISGFPPAVPEVPVSSIDNATKYYTTKLGFTCDWGDEAGGIAGISRDQSRIFLTNPTFRARYGTTGAVMIWLNVNSKAEVDELYAEWRRSEAKIVSPPEDKPWQLREFTAADLDGNLFRVFYDSRGDTEGSPGQPRQPCVPRRADRHVPTVTFQPRQIRPPSGLACSRSSYPLRRAV